VATLVDPVEDDGVPELALRLVVQRGVLPSELGEVNLRDAHKRTSSNAVEGPRKAPGGFQTTEPGTSVQSATPAARAKTASRKHSLAKLEPMQ
jgi:hypothetical protein